MAVKLWFDPGGDPYRSAASHAAVRLSMVRGSEGLGITETLEAADVNPRC